MITTPPIVILGTGLAGYSLGRELRKLDKTIPLVFITADDGRSYSKPMLSTGFSKKKTADELAQASAATMAEKLNATILCHTTVIDIDRHNKTLVLDKGEPLVYAKLVFAVGANCINLPIEGDASDEIHSINNLMDYHRFRQSLENKKRVFIIGAGLIGCEYANDLGAGGFQVSCADVQDHVLASLLPEPASRAVQTALQHEYGTQFHLGQRVTRIDKDGDAFRVSITSADSSHADNNNPDTTQPLTITSDIVLSAVGVRANTELAQASGITVKRGIVVDRHLQTSDADIYALGDCAEVNGHLMYFVMPLMICARALAPTLLGTPTAVRYDAMAVGVKTPVCPVQVVPTNIEQEGRWTISGDAHNVRALFHNQQGELQGFALTGSHIAEKVSLTKALPPMLA